MRFAGLEAKVDHHLGNLDSVLLPQLPTRQDPQEMPLTPPQGWGRPGCPWLPFPLISVEEVSPELSWCVGSATSASGTRLSRPQQVPRVVGLKQSNLCALVLEEALGLRGRTPLQELERFPTYTSAKVHFLIWTYMALHMYLGSYLHLSSFRLLLLAPARTPLRSYLGTKVAITPRVRRPPCSVGRGGAEKRPCESAGPGASQEMGPKNHVEGSS